MTEDKKLPAIISLNEMVESINRSGYLIEQRVEQIFFQNGYYVETNPAYKDVSTGKSREYDINAITALILYKEPSDFIYPIIICECMNNYQPIVFFIKDDPVTSFMFCDDLKYSGLPVKFWQRGDFINLPDFALMEKYHHYCKGPFATQYCTFTKKDRHWVAFHNDEQHNSINSLVQAIEQEIETHYSRWTINEDEVENVNIQIYYPLVILQGNIYGAIIHNENIELKEMDHVQYRKQIIMHGQNKTETYQVDFISEKYLPEYLKILDSEYMIIKKYFMRKKHIVRKSIKMLTDEILPLKEKPGAFRQVFEFKI